jgi:gamma-glutamylcyclotransferase (GGCT)/AIG2-like uncharacterized protein YtfP
MNSLFVYGTLKQGEIAHSQIKDYVEDVFSAELSGYELGIRDGLPVIFEQKEFKVSGELLIPKKDSEEKFWQKIENYESSKLYSKKSVKINLGQEIVESVTYVAKKEKGRSYIPLTNANWTTLNYPHFAYAFPILFNSIKNLKLETYPADMYFDYWKYMNDLQQKYLLLVSHLENIAILIFGPSNESGPISRIKQLGESAEWSTAFSSVKNQSGLQSYKVKDVRNLKDQYNNESADRAILMYYQIRNNLTHQGKSGSDCKLIFDALQDLSKLIKELLIIKVDGIEKIWNMMLNRIQVDVNLNSTN